MPLVISGEVKTGLNKAAWNVEKQFEHVAKDYPDKDIQQIPRWGTLNIELDFPLRIKNPDYITHAIEYHPGVKERFSLTRVALQPNRQASDIQPAWIYMAEWSPHRYDTRFIEVLTATVNLSISRKVYVILPEYRYSSCVFL
jgi:hypothetical protein